MVEQVENFAGQSQVYFRFNFYPMHQASETELGLRKKNARMVWEGMQVQNFNNRVEQTPTCAPFEGQGCTYSTQENQACWALSSRSPSPGPHCLGWFHSCLSTVMITYAIHPLQQTQHLSAGEGPYNAPYNTNKHDCYKKIRLQNITLCQTPVDCKFKFWLSQEPGRF